MSQTSKGEAICRPSAASQWLNCPGSIGECLDVPVQAEEVSPEAAEGTLAHEEAKEILTAWVKGQPTPAPSYEIQPYLDRVKYEASLFDTDPAPNMRVEQHLVLNGEMKLQGTADFLITGNKKGVPTGVIVDLKYGRGVPVDAVGNPQLAYYACALKVSSKLRLEKVKVVIVQPRAQNPDAIESEAVYSREELDQWAAVLTRGAERSLMQILVRSSRELNPGTWCQFCRARFSCGKRLEVIEREGEFSVEVLPKALTLEKKVKLFQISKSLKKLLNDIEDDLFLRVSQGEQIFGVGLKKGRGSRVWNIDDESEIARELESRGINPWKTELISVAQAEKKGKIDGLFVKIEGKPKLAAKDGELLIDFDNIEE